MTEFADRIYDTYVILGVGSAPWEASTWAAISDALAPLVRLSRGTAAIRTDQLGGTPPNMKPISFGRIAFDTKGADKWTHSPTGHLSSGSHSLFLGAELWAPTWTVCEREHHAPDLYFGMSNERGYNDNASPKFNSLLLLAVAEDLKCQRVADIAVDIGRVVAARLVAYEQRPWGKRWGAGGSFTNAINDLTVTGLFVPGPRHERPVDLTLLQGDWKQVQAAT